MSIEDDPRWKTDSLYMHHSAFRFAEEVYNIFEIEEDKSYQDVLEMLKVIKVAAKYYLGVRGERKFLGRSFNELSIRVANGDE